MPSFAVYLCWHQVFLERVWLGLSMAHLYMLWLSTRGHNVLLSCPVSNGVFPQNSYLAVLVIVWEGSFLLPPLCWYSKFQNTLHAQLQTVDDLGEVIFFTCWGSKFQPYQKCSSPTHVSWSISWVNFLPIVLRCKVPTISLVATASCLSGLMLISLPRLFMHSELNFLNPIP